MPPGRAATLFRICRGTPIRTRVALNQGHVRRHSKHFRRSDDSAMTHNATASPSDHTDRTILPCRFRTAQYVGCNGVAQCRDKALCGAWGGIEEQRWLGQFQFEQTRAIGRGPRSEEHTYALQALMRISYALFCLTTNNNTIYIHTPRAFAQVLRSN